MVASGRFLSAMLVTQWIEKTLRRRVVFNCGNEQVLLWGPPKEADVKETVERLKHITAHVIDRVDAEFRHLAPFSSFDVPVLREAFACNEQTRARTLQGNLQRHIMKIAKDLKADEATAAIEYCEVAPLILDLTSRGRPLATASNSEVWAAMLDPNVRLSHLPQRSTFRTLHVLIRFYISIEDGECAVERDLGVLAKFEQAHTNGGNDLADDLIMAKTDTTTADDICAGGLAVGSCAQLGPTGRRWATLWRAVHGARLGCYRISSRCKRGKRPGTYEAAKAGVLAAAEYAVATNGSVAQMNEGEDKIVPLGVRQSFLKAPLGDKADAYTNKAMKRFAALTVAKRLKAQPFINRCTKPKWVENEQRSLLRGCIMLKRCAMWPPSENSCLTQSLTNGEASTKNVEGFGVCSPIWLSWTI